MWFQGLFTSKCLVSAYKNTEHSWNCIPQNLTNRLYLSFTKYKYMFYFASIVDQDAIGYVILMSLLIWFLLIRKMSQYLQTQKPKLQKCLQWIWFIIPILLLQQIQPLLILSYPALLLHRKKLIRMVAEQFVVVRHAWIPNMCWMYMYFVASFLFTKQNAMLWWPKSLACFSFSILFHSMIS